MTVIQQTTPVTRFCLIRHGETDWNRARRIQGQIDIDLNATGEAQAQALVHGLREHHFAAAYSSDLLRAWRTAQIASRRLGVAVLPAPTLRERHFGVLQGCTHDEAQERWPEAYRHHQSRTPDYDYQDGESLNVFAARVMAALEMFALRHPGEQVLLFTHGGVLDVVYRHATGRSVEQARDFPLANAALNWVEHHSGAWRLVSWADSRHLLQSLDEVTG
jgi:probable phosphoglycerate mutase